MKITTLTELNGISAMVIKGTVHNGQIKIESSSLLEGTQVLIIPIQLTKPENLPDRDLNGLKAEIHRIASLASENSFNDGFSGADQDKIRRRS